MRLIDKDALAARLEDKCKEWEGESAYQAGLCAAAVIVAEAPTVEQEPTIGGWISVKDKLPDDTAKGRLYLVVNNGNVDVGIFHYGLWLLPTNNVNVSHWMPFPEAPKEGE